jgi:hypothetical protein
VTSGDAGESGAALARPALILECPSGSISDHDRDDFSPPRESCERGGANTMFAALALMEPPRASCSRAFLSARGARFDGTAARIVLAGVSVSGRRSL